MGADVNSTLELRPGEWVEVRSEAEILATLRDDGTLDELPFMPEMLVHCGRRFQVFRRADKTCDTVTWTGLRSMARTVHLTTPRCDGAGHGGCQAGCLLFWKEAWLKRVEGPSVKDNGASPLKAGSVSDGVIVPLSANGISNGNGAAATSRNRDWLERTIYRVPPEEGEIRYRCQATEVVKASCPLPWWKPGQYVRDVCANDVRVGEVIRGLAIAAYSKFHKLFTGHSWPRVTGTLKKTPTASLDLKAGEWVVVKSKEEILATLDGNGRNRGLSFDSEMIPYCGKRVRVLRRVERIIEETTGRLFNLPGVAIILEHVVCLSIYRRSCPRAIFPYWREIWLRRAEPETEAEPSTATAAPTAAEPQPAGAEL